jgi:hypothetical protein
MCDPDDFTPCELCDKDPETCDQDPDSCLENMCEDFHDGEREARE